MNKTLYLLCLLISMVSASAGAPKANVTESAQPVLKWWIFRQDCYDKIVVKQDFSD